MVLIAKKLSKEERRESLIKAASALFMEKGYHETTTKDIAMAAGITEPIIYKHFSGKQELFFESIYEIASTLIDNLDIKEELDPEEFMQRFIYLHMDIAEKHFDSIRFILIQILEEPEVRKIFIRTLLPKIKSKIHPLIKGISHGKDEDVEYNLFLLGGILMIAELTQGLFKASPGNLSRKDLSEKLAGSFLRLIKGGTDNEKK